MKNILISRLINYQLYYIIYRLKKVIYKNPKKDKFFEYCDILVKNETDVLFITDFKNRIKFIGSTSKRFFGNKEFDEFKRFTIKFYSDYFEELFKKAKHKNDWAYPYLDFPVKSPKGHYSWIRLSANIKKIHDSFFLVANIKDINSQVHLYSTNQSNVWFNIVNKSRNGVLVEDSNHSILYVNDALLSFFDIKDQYSTFVGKNSQILLQSQKPKIVDFSQFYNTLKEQSEEKNHRKSVFFELKNGKTIERKYIRLIDPTGQYSHIWYYQDDTQNFELNKKVKQSEEKHRKIIENMQLGILEVNNDDVIVNVYNQFCRMTGYSKEELIGKVANEILLKPEDKPAFKIRERQRMKGKDGSYEVPIVKKDGSTAWLLVSGTCVFNSENEIIGSIGIHYDITERKKLEEELKQANDIAKKATEMEKVFFASMTHELKTPINTILGMEGLLKTTDLDAEQKDYLAILETSTSFLQKIISDILDVSKIETGNLNLDIQSFDLKKIIDELVRSFEHSFAKKNIFLVFDWQIEPNNFILGDPLVLQQIITNLLSNAEKFTNEGMVKLSVQCLNQSEQTIEIRFIVEDTGIGIDIKDQESVFDKFVQLPSSKQHKSIGTGLGLSIVKSLVEIQKGTISVTSNLGQGSIFTVDLSYPKCLEITKDLKNKNLITQPLNFQSEDFRVLIVEDNQLNQEYLKRLFTKWAIYHEIVSSGEEAIERFAIINFNCVMMDIQLPGLNGFESSKILRAKFPNHTFCIIAMTAVLFPHIDLEILNYGIDSIIKKPFTTDELYQKMSECLNDYKKLVNVQDQIIFDSELDADFLTKFYGNDIDYAIDVFGKFTAIYIRMFESLIYSSDHRAIKDIKKMLHTIKPSFKMVGLTKMEEAIDEAINNENLDFDMLRKLFSKEDIRTIETLIENQIFKLKHQKLFLKSI